MTWILSFPPPDETLTLNSRVHHHKRARIVATWRKATWAHAVNAISRGRLIKNSPSCYVRVRFPVTSISRRRDPHNYVATVKPIIDGLVDARIWPDDTADWVTVLDPTFHEGKDVVIELSRS